MSARVLLEADNLDIWRQEVQAALGTVRAARYVVRNSSATEFIIDTIPIQVDQVIRVHTTILAKQVSGTGTGSVSSREMYATFKHFNGTVSQVGSTDDHGSVKDDTNWSQDYEIDGETVNVVAYFNGANGADGLHVVFNVYSYIHSMKES